MTESHFEGLGLPATAIEWLLDLWTAIQALDDVVDGHPVENADTLPWILLVGLPANQFFRDNALTLLPVMANVYLRWRAANTVESAGNADEKSFVWRAGYYDVILQCVLLVHGVQKAAELAPAVMNLYGEKFEDYRKEFDA